MGTKIQANGFLRGYHPVIDLDGSTSNGMRSLHQENQMTKNGFNCDSFTSRISINGHSGYDTEIVRQTILEHESIFRNQIQELHRLYRRQQELTNEIKRREIKKDEQKSKSSSFSYLSNVDKQFQERFPKLPGFESTSRFNGESSGFGFHFKRNNEQSYLNPTGVVSANSCSNLNLVTKDFMQDFSSGKTIPVNNSIVSEPRKEISKLPLDMGTSLSRRKRKIFGVEISEQNDQENQCGVPFESSSSWIASSFAKNLELGGKNANNGKYEGLKADSTKYFMHLDETNFKTEEVLKKDSEQSKKLFQDMVPHNNHVLLDSRSKQENPKGGLPWFLKNTQYNGNPRNETKSSYFMNMDSLQNCSQNFFKKAEIAEKEEISAINEVNDGASAKKILGFPISDMLKDLNTKTDENVETEDLFVKKGSNNYIDLNLSLNDEDDDLEAPAVTEPEKIVSCEESDRIASEGIIAISLSRVREPQKDVNFDRLKLLAEIIHDDVEKQESILPDGMDHFEFMTLKLKDTKEENYHYHHSFISHDKDSDDEKRYVKLPKRARRGRQKKDFQRDVLPGLVTLSRAQLTEDFQTFEELMKGEVSFIRNGRGRKRSGGTPVKAQCTTPKKQQQTVCQHEERSLTGWGKKTRRLPRQRCSNNAFLSFSVKC